ncbi:MAG: hypothetical protein QNK23_18255 [Crocinitomicaceae bacterium]|nr:hypothetical protein [Crocinitomicaceae bacterium]
MRAEEICKLNEANFILRHFVDLSARLLPFLDELQRKKNPTREELNSINRIIEVFENHQFDTQTSMNLMNSNVLDLIKRSYENISQTSYFLKPGQPNGCLYHFMCEHDRLKENWFLIESN